MLTKLNRKQYSAETKVATPVPFLGIWGRACVTVSMKSISCFFIACFQDALYASLRTISSRSCAILSGCTVSNISANASLRPAGDENHRMYVVMKFFTNLGVLLRLMISLMASFMFSPRCSSEATEAPVSYDDRMSH